MDAEKRIEALGGVDGGGASGEVDDPLQDAAGGFGTNVHIMRDDDPLGDADGSGLNPHALTDPLEDVDGGEDSSVTDWVDTLEGADGGLSNDNGKTDGLLLNDVDGGSVINGANNGIDN